MKTPQIIWDAPRLESPHRQTDKARRVQSMFDAIAPTYERVNRILSAGCDAYWRKRAVSLARITPDDLVLDIACGTGDFARAFQRARPARVVGSDFAEKMLTLAATRTASKIHWCRGDALSLPFNNATFSVISCAFGVRNFQDLAQGLREMHRTLRPGGRAVVLEFSLPRTKILSGAYLFYFHRILPRLARMISGDKTGAYDYLPKSVSAFVAPEGMIKLFQEAGFVAISLHPLSAGIVTIYLAHKP